MAPRAILNDTLDLLAGTLVDSESGGEESSPESGRPVDDAPLPISKRKRGPGKKKGKLQLITRILL